MASQQKEQTEAPSKLDRMKERTAQAAQGGGAEQGLRLSVGAILRPSGAVTGRQAGRHGVRGGRGAR